MRVKYKDKYGNLHVAETFEAYRRKNGGLGIHCKYTNTYNEIRAEIICFETDNAEALLNKAFETGLLDLTNENIVDAINENDCGGCSCIV